LTAVSGWDVSSTGALTATSAGDGRLLSEVRAGDLVQFSGLEYFVDTLTDNDTGQLDMTLEGKLAVTLNSDIVNGVGTKFTHQLRAGDDVSMNIDGTTQTATITSVDSDTQLTLSAAVTSTELGTRLTFSGDGTGDLSSAAISGVGSGQATQAGQYLFPSSVQAFLDQIASGIDTVIAQRVRLGSFQARLERATETAKIQIENLTEAESVIRDADMALEVSALVRAQVLAQAGTAVLNAANLAPQNVLGLMAAIS
jgi:flagellin